MNHMDYEDYYILFIDILGFKHKIENSNFSEMKSLYDRIESLKKIYPDEKEPLTKVVKHDTTQTLHPKALVTPEHYETALFPKFICLSDTLIFLIQKKYHQQIEAFINSKLPKRFRHEKFPGDLLYIAEDIQRELFNIHNILCRGCIHIGKIYTPQGSDLVFGKGLIEAYNYESYIAKFPRIIISKEFFNEYKDHIIDNKILKLDEDGYYHVEHINFNETIITKNIEENAANMEILQKWEWLDRNRYKSENND